MDFLRKLDFHLIVYEAGTGRDHAHMKIDLDPQSLQVSMGMWRKATDMEVPLAPHPWLPFVVNNGYFGCRLPFR